jgi:hypothetical protein
MLALYDLPRSASSQRQIGGIAASNRRRQRLAAGEPVYLPGARRRGAPDDRRGSLRRQRHPRLSPTIVERFLALYVHANSFTQAGHRLAQNRRRVTHMFAKKRRFEPAVIERLFKEPYRFEYFQAVRLLELWLKRHGMRRPAGPVANLLRFQNSTSLRFPASQLEAIQPSRARSTTGKRWAKRAARPLKWVRLTPAFMGLLGCSGVLPAHYTERIAEHEMRQGRGTARLPRHLLEPLAGAVLRSLAQVPAAFQIPTRRQGQLPAAAARPGRPGQPVAARRLARPENGAVLDESIGYFAAAMRHRPASSARSRAC